jgi:hypothetical protein
MTEQLPYEVVRAFPRFDVRRYPDSVLVQVRVAADAARAVSLGARTLLRYLDGHNQAGTLFAGPAAALRQEPAGEHEHVVSLVLPTGTDPATVPEPRDDSVSIRAVPAHEAAVLRFAGAVYFIRLEPTWKPGFLGRNEALVRVTSA